MKKLILAALVLAMVLCGCAPASAPQQVPTELPPETIPQELPTETIPQELPTESTQPEQTEPPVQLPQVSIQDQYAQVYQNPYIDDVYCIHIPQFVWDGRTDLTINEQIYFDHMGRIDANTYDDQPMVKVLYGMGQANGLASVVTAFRNQDYEYVTYSIFHLDIASGQEANDLQIIEAFGYTQESFREKVRQVMEEKFHRDNGQMKDMMEGQYYEQTLAEHLSDENINSARPYIDENGQLCFMAKLYGFAGAGHYYGCIVLESGDSHYGPQYISCDVHG